MTEEVRTRLLFLGEMVKKGHGFVPNVGLWHAMKMDAARAAVQPLLAKRSTPSLKTF